MFRSDKLRSAGRQITESSTAFLDGNAVLLQEPVGKIFKAGSTVQHRRNLFPQGIFLRFQTSSAWAVVQLRQGAAFARSSFWLLPTPSCPILGFAHALLRAVEQVDLVQSGTLAQLHDLDTEVSHGLGCAGVLHTLTPIAGLLHIGLTLHFSCSDAADHDVDMDVSRMVVSIRVSADDGRMTGEVFFAEFQAKCLCLFHGQAVVGCISWVEADDILMALNITMLGVLTILAVCQQTGCCKREIAALKGVGAGTNPAASVLPSSSRSYLAGKFIVLVNEVRFDGGVVRVLRADMLERCHTVHPELSRR